MSNAPLWTFDELVRAAVGRAECASGAPPIAYTRVAVEPRGMRNDSTSSRAVTCPGATVPPYVQRDPNSHGQSRVSCPIGPIAIATCGASKSMASRSDRQSPRREGVTATLTVPDKVREKPRSVSVRELRALPSAFFKGLAADDLAALSGVMFQRSYPAGQAPSLLAIRGAAHGPPAAPGRRWTGEDVIAALALARAVRDRPWLKQVDHIDVSLHARDGSLRMISDRGCTITLERVADVLMTQLNLFGDLARQVSIASFHAPYVCPRCGAEASPVVEVAGNAALLRAMTAPSVPCPECRSPMDLGDFPERYLSVFKG